VYEDYDEKEKNEKLNEDLNQLVMIETDTLFLLTLIL